MTMNAKKRMNGAWRRKRKNKKLTGVVLKFRKNVGCTRKCWVQEENPFCLIYIAENIWWPKSPCPNIKSLNNHKKGFVLLLAFQNWYWYPFYKTIFFYQNTPNVSHLPYLKYSSSFLFPPSPFPFPFLSHLPCPSHLNPSH